MANFDKINYRKKTAELIKIMELVFFRHGKALSIEEAKVSSDTERPLSENGKAQVLESLKNLKAENFFPEAILSSPYKRAIQTAEIISDFYSCKEIVLLEEIARPSEIKTLIELIKNFSNNRNSIVVGHQPILGTIVKTLTVSQDIILKPAGYARIEIQDINSLKGILKSNFNPQL